MPHVDEGTLHALLDGALRAMEPDRADAVEAHLARCAECRALAEAAAADRGRAADILGLLEPAVRPDFDEVLVRAGTAGAAGAAGAARILGGPAAGRLSRQVRWTRGIAWAATIVIALGTGYLIRDRLVPERTASSMAGPPAEPAEAAEGVGTGVRPQAADARPQPVGAGAEREEPLAEPARGGAEPPDPGVQPSGETATFAGGAAGEETAAASRRGEAAATPAEDRVRQSPVRQPSPAPASVAEANPSAASAPVAVAPAPPPPSPAEAAAFQGALGLESVVVTGAAAADSAVDPADVADLLGAPLLVLPGAEVVDVFVEGPEDDRRAVSLQRLGGGAVVRVAQRPLERAPLGSAVEKVRPDAASGAGAAPAPARALRADRPGAAPLGQPLRREPLEARSAADAGPVATVRVVVGGAELVLEGALPAAALERLGAAAAPYGARR